MDKKPILRLVGAYSGPPTVEDLVKLSKALTGVDPSPAEVEALRAEMAQWMKTHE